MGSSSPLFHCLRNLFTGSISYGVDLAVLSSCNHTVETPSSSASKCRRIFSQVLDYGTFGLWAGLLAGGRIVLPSGSISTPSTFTQIWAKVGHQRLTLKPQLCMLPRLLKCEFPWHGVVGESKTSQCGVHRCVRTKHRSTFRNLKLVASLALTRIMKSSKKEWLRWFFKCSLFSTVFEA